MLDTCKVESGAEGSTLAAGVADAPPDSVYNDHDHRKPSRHGAQIAAGGSDDRDAKAPAGIVGLAALKAVGHVVLKPEFLGVYVPLRWKAALKFNGVEGTRNTIPCPWRVSTTTFAEERAKCSVARCRAIASSRRSLRCRAWSQTA